MSPLASISAQRCKDLELAMANRRKRLVSALHGSRDTWDALQSASRAALVAVYPAEARMDCDNVCRLWLAYEIAIALSGWSRL